MKLIDIMTKNVEAVSVETTISAAANVMARHDIGFLPVIEGDKLVGTITDRDIVVRGLAENNNPTTTPVNEIMTKCLETLSPDEDVEQAAALMQEKQIRRLVLQDRDGRYVGVVSLGDIAQHAHDWKMSGESLDKICEPVATGP
ncbi:Hypoxic response protein 1 [Symmachiella dynata]|uniref:Hypoxic response protein 1 n=1 Tax=Symmachiella dynata TaxID=2527995 RepID=A0A517ZV51_9PLAN|nr:CBS domain-containing protein [Symmachiella dynata]QDT50707.1 Hypoxic response protein 1 [Symmachiella dynata]QDU46364.1 Hypoxic response protein 1 [Symmachiella dynata]